MIASVGKGMGIYCIYMTTCSAKTFNTFQGTDLDKSYAVSVFDKSIHHPSRAHVLFSTDFYCIHSCNYCTLV